MGKARVIRPGDDIREGTGHFTYTDPKPNAGEITLSNGETVLGPETQWAGPKKNKGVMTEEEKDANWEYADEGEGDEDELQEEIDPPPSRQRTARPALPLVPQVDKLTEPLEWREDLVEHLRVGETFGFW